jgi:hypothetical protein
MKAPKAASIIVGGFAVVLSVSVGLGIGQAGPVVGRYPASSGAAHEKFDFSSLPHGYLGIVGTYFTRDEPDMVRHWYASQFDVEPEDGVNSGDHCLKLSGVQSFAGLGRVVGVTVCDAHQGTNVSVNQTVYWKPAW